MTTREWSVEKSSVDLRDLQATTMALSKADEGQVYGIEFIMVTISFSYNNIFINKFSNINFHSRWHYSVEKDGLPW